MNIMVNKLPNRIIIQIIPHKNQRYDTAGDYWEDGHTWNFRISDMKDWESELLCAMHELTEKILCKKRNITDAQIDSFDTSKYAMKLSDPGLSKKAPYHKEHMIGMKIERILCKELKKKWNLHNDNYRKLVYK